MPGGHELAALPEYGLSEDGCRGGAVSGNVRGLGCDLLYHLRAHVLELVLKLDFLGNRYAVLGDERRAV